MIIKRNVCPMDAVAGLKVGARVRFEAETIFSGTLYSVEAADGFRVMDDDSGLFRFGGDDPPFPHFAAWEEDEKYPMPGDAVRIVNSNDALVPDGTLGIIQGRIGRPEETYDLLWRPSPCPFRDLVWCNSSGGPQYSDAPTAALTLAGTHRQLFWRWGPHGTGAGNGVEYTLDIPLWDADLQLF